MVEEKSQTFDIFVYGIDENRLDESEQIKENAAKMLQITLEQIEEILATDNACIYQDASEEEAQKYQDVLGKIGLVCSYKTIKRSSLSLVPMDAAHTGGTFACPSCHEKVALDDDEAQPETCPVCHVDVVLFVKQQKEKAEREAIKARLLASNKALQRQASLVQQEEAEKKRKQDLEKEILKELQGNVSKQPLNKMLILGGVVVIAASLFAVQFLNSKSEPAKVEENKTTEKKAAPEENASPAVAVDEKLPVTQPEQPSAQSTPTLEAPQNAQQSLQQAHDQAAKLLEGVGLNADAFAGKNNANSASAPIILPEENGQTPAPQIVNSITAPQNTVTSSAPALLNQSSVVSVHNAQTVQNVTQTTNSISNLIISTASNDNKQDLIINKKIKAGSKNALKLINYVSDDAIFVESVGFLLKKSPQSAEIKAAIEMRLNNFSPEKRAFYFAKIAAFLPSTNGTNDFLQKAQQFSTALPLQSKNRVEFEIAVSAFKLNNIALANQYLSQINTALNAQKNLDEQIQMRLFIADAYLRMGNTIVAQTWLNSIKNAISKISITTLEEALTVYAKLNSRVEPVTTY